MMRVDEKKLLECCKEVELGFIYSSDHDKFDNWRTYKGNKVYGDCEDYSLTVMYHYFDKSLIKFLFMLLFSSNVNIHYVITNGVGHAVGQVGYLWFDNFTYWPYVRTEFFKKTNHFHVRKFSKMVLLYKLVSSKINRLMRHLR